MRMRILRLLAPAAPSLPAPPGPVPPAPSPGRGPAQILPCRGVPPQELPGVRLLPALRGEAVHGVGPVGEGEDDPPRPGPGLPGPEDRVAPPQGGARPGIC